MGPLFSTAVVCGSAGELVGHEARAVPQMGWARKRNGALLALAEAEFAVFLTVDRSLSFQRNLRGLNVESK